MTERKIFSVIIPVKDGAETIERGLDSLLSSADFINEVIICIDHCTDNTEELAAQYSDRLPIKFVYNKGNPGPGNSRQLGLDNARSEWVTFMDADDEFYPRAFWNIYKVITTKLLPDDVIIISGFESVFKGFSRYEYQNSLTWVHGKFFQRSFLVENNIHFPKDLYTSEDSSFMEYCRLYTILRDKNFFMYNYKSYRWNYREGSMTREEDFLRKRSADFLEAYCGPFVEVVDNNEISDEKLDILIQSEYSLLTGLVVFCYFCAQSDWGRPDVYAQELARWLRDLEANKSYLLTLILDNPESYCESRKNACSCCGPFIEHQTFYDWYEALDWTVK
jgi:glycosyltransferase involved in cell wall biosynthesis